MSRILRFSFLMLLLAAFHLGAYAQEQTEAKTAKVKLTKSEKKELNDSIRARARQRALEKEVDRQYRKLESMVSFGIVTDKFFHLLVMSARRLIRIHADKNPVHLFGDLVREILFLYLQTMVLDLLFGTDPTVRRHALGADHIGELDSGADCDAHKKRTSVFYPMYYHRSFRIGSPVLQILPI